jgi:hypothetical protein
LRIDTLADTELHGTAADHRGGRAAQAVLAHHAADIIAHRLDFFFANRGGVDFEKDMGTALQIEAEHQLALRPFRPRL